MIPEVVISKIQLCKDFYSKLFCLLSLIGKLQGIKKNQVEPIDQCFSTMALLTF